MTKSPNHIATDKWKANNREKYRNNAKDWHLKKRYGITLEDYNIMLFEQDGCCSICGIHHTEVYKGLAVDHCHESGKIRGLLCGNCNQGLGRFKDDITLFKNAIKYLKCHK